MNFVIRKMKESDIDGLTKAFAPLNKPREEFEMFWKAHQEGQRVTFLAVSEGVVAGYANLLWQSDYAPFQKMGIPEINNLHVLDAFHKQGIGTALIQAAERVAATQATAEIGIGVGLTSNYSAAQRLYPKLGYLPDGRGAQPTPWGEGYT